VTGQPTLEYLKPRLFEPLGIENPQWDSSPEGNSLGGYGLKLRTEGIEIVPEGRSAVRDINLGVDGYPLLIVAENPYAGGVDATLV